MSKLLALSAAGGLGVASLQHWIFGGGSSTSPTLDPDVVVPTRAQQIAKLQAASQEGPNQPYDLLIIGGGATGAGCALDAATRGLRVALVERGDFASGTSSKSTKLIHGGVRYLEKAVFNADLGQLRLVFEALQERKSMLEAAPHLCKPLAILTPCYSWWEVPYYWAGLKAYDLVAGLRNLVMSRYVGPTESLSLLPTLAHATPEGRRLKGTVMYYDGQFDDARFNVGLAVSAAAAGATVVNHMEVTELIKNDRGEVIGARCMDRLAALDEKTAAAAAAAAGGSAPGGAVVPLGGGIGGGGGGKEVAVYARAVINAAGPFVDGVRKLADDRAAPMVAASSGVHITLPDYLGSPSTGLIIPRTKDGRVVFMLPWLGKVIAGTTDTPCEVTPSPAASEADVSFILEALTDYLGVRVGREDVLSAWSGIRPLVAPQHAEQGNATSGIVRDHVVCVDRATGLITVTGGKWTTYRRMAQDTVDAAVASGRLPLNTRHCVTSGLQLLGAEGYGPALQAELARQYTATFAAPAATAAAGGAKPQQQSTQQQQQGEDAGAGSSGSGAISSCRRAAAGAVSAHLAASYGTRAPRVLQAAADSGLGGALLVAGHPILEAEVLYCVRHEYCERLADFLSRRTRLAFLDAPAALSAVPRVAALMGRECGWSAGRVAAEVADATAYLQTSFLAARGGTPSTPAAMPAPAAGPAPPSWAPAA